MTELQYLILKTYYDRKEINSYEFYNRFETQYPQFTLKQIREEVGYLHGSLFIDSPKDKFNTLGITKAGEEKYKLEEAALQQRKRFPGSEHFQPASSLHEDFPETGQSIIIQPNLQPSSNSLIKYIMRLVILISKHPLWSAIIAGIAVLLFSHFVFHVP